MRWRRRSARFGAGSPRPAAAGPNHVRLRGGTVGNAARHDGTDDGADFGGHDGRSAASAASGPAPSVDPHRHAIVMTAGLKVRRKGADDVAGPVTPAGRVDGTATAPGDGRDPGAGLGRSRGRCAHADHTERRGRAGAGAPRRDCSLPDRRLAPVEADRVRLARLRDETARLEREIRTVEAKLAARAHAATGAALRPDTAAPSPRAPASAHVTRPDDGGGGDD